MWINVISLGIMYLLLQQIKTIWCCDYEICKNYSNQSFLIVSPGNNRQEIPPPAPPPEPQQEEPRQEQNVCLNFFVLLTKTLSHLKAGISLLGTSIGQPDCSWAFQPSYSTNIWIYLFSYSGSKYTPRRCNW